MKKTLQRLGMVAVGLSLCLWSCDKQDVNVQPNETTASIVPKVKEKIDFSVVEGRLKFETVDDFKAALAKTTTPEEVGVWEQQGGFTSLDEAYKEFLSKKSSSEEKVIDKEYDDVLIITTNDEGKKNFERALTMTGLAVLSNQDGILQIADKVMKISDETVKITDVNFKNELELDSPSNHVKVNKVIHSKINEASKSAKVASFDNYDWWHYPNPNNNRRFVIHKYANLYNLFYTYSWEIGVNIRHERDNWWSWDLMNIDSWSWSPGYMTLVPVPGNGANVTANNIFYNQSTSQPSGSSVGYANFYLVYSGTANPTLDATQLGARFTFNPGTVIGNTYGPQVFGGNNHPLAFDGYL